MAGSLLFPAGKDEEDEGRLPVPAPTTLLPDIGLSIVKLLCSIKQGWCSLIQVFYLAKVTEKDQKMLIKASICGKPYTKSPLNTEVDQQEDVELLSVLVRMFEVNILRSFKVQCLKILEQRIVEYV
jgi:hypothetical protein